jgi:hypothetical protein
MAKATIAAAMASIVAMRHAHVRRDRRAYNRADGANLLPAAEHAVRLSAAKATKAIFTMDIDMVRFLILG